MRACACLDPDDWLCFNCRAEVLPRLAAEISKELVTTISFIDVIKAREGGRR